MHYVKIVVSCFDLALLNSIFMNKHFEHHSAFFGAFLVNPIYSFISDWGFLVLFWKIESLLNAFFDMFQKKKKLMEIDAATRWETGGKKLTNVTGATLGKQTKISSSLTLNECLFSPISYFTMLNHLARVCNL